MAVYLLFNHAASENTDLKTDNALLKRPSSLRALHVYGMYDSLSEPILFVTVSQKSFNFIKGYVMNYAKIINTVVLLSALNMGAGKEVISPDGKLIATIFAFFSQCLFFVYFPKPVVIKKLQNTNTLYSFVDAGLILLQHK